MVFCYTRLQFAFTESGIVTLSSCTCAIFVYTITNQCLRDSTLPSNWYLEYLKTVDNWWESVHPTDRLYNVIIVYVLIQIIMV